MTTTTTVQTASVTVQTAPVNSTAGLPKAGGKKDESKKLEKKGNTPKYRIAFIKLARV